MSNRDVPYIPKNYEDNTNGGVYCYYPYDNLDAKKYGIFKIGMTENFKDRVDHYHTALPAGVYFKAFLENPNINPFGKEVITMRQYLMRVEKEIHQYIIAKGGASSFYGYSEKECWTN